MADSQLTVSGTVALGKPWYLSKKIWLAVIGLGAALYAAITGKAETTDQVVVLVTKVASILGVVAPLILAVAHVDGKERELATAIIQAGKSLDQPDVGDAPIPLPPKPGPVGVPGLDRAS